MSDLTIYEPLIWPDAVGHMVDRTDTILGTALKPVFVPDIEFLACVRVEGGGVRFVVKAPASERPREKSFEETLRENIRGYGAPAYTAWGTRWRRPDLFDDIINGRYPNHWGRE